MDCRTCAQADWSAPCPRHSKDRNRSYLSYRYVCFSAYVSLCDPHLSTTRVGHPVSSHTACLKCWMQPLPCLYARSEIALATSQHLYFLLSPWTPISSYHDRTFQLYPIMRKWDRPKALPLNLYLFHSLPVSSFPLHLIVRCEISIESVVLYYSNGQQTAASYLPGRKCDELGSGLFTRALSMYLW